jgi:hypothetical protein
MRGVLLLGVLGLSLLTGVGQEAPFRDAASDVGLGFHHFNGATGELYMPEIMGSGCALFDYDNDGDLDVYLVQGAPPDPTKGAKKATFPPPPGSPPGSRLLRNDLVPSGVLHFTDVTEAAGVGHQGWGMGAATGDVDNDGDLDLYVTALGSNVLYRNNGDGTFSDVTRESGTDDPRWSTSAAFFDYDRDGDLDLYVANYVDFTFRNNKRCFAPTGEPDYCTPKAYGPLRSRLFRNDGHGRFEDSQAAGVAALAGPSLGVTVADFNGDGWIDIYVANDGAANFLWLAKGDGTFEEAGPLSGAAYGMDGIARAGMGVAAGDFDDDGDEDLFVTNLVREGSVLFSNDGRGRFQDVSLASGLARASFLVTGFGTGWLDYDNDGRLDLFAANGAVTMLPAQKGTDYPFRQRNQLFHNEGAGAFREVSPAVGAERAEVGRGAAFGDVDNDGDVDVLVANNNGPARLLLNESDRRQHWLSVRLEGVRDNRFGLGARVAVLRNGHAPLWRRAHTDGSYLSASDSRVHFGLGASSGISGVLVQWPSGARERWARSEVDRQVTLRQHTGEAQP